MSRWRPEAWNLRSPRWWGVGSWVVVPILGLWWALRRLVHTYFFYDEWGMIASTLHLGPWKLATRGGLGHLWFFEGFAYRLQLLWFGAEHKQLILTLFLVALVCLHLAVAATLRASGVPAVVAPVAAGVVVYLGPAAQNFVFTMQFSVLFAMAGGITVAVIAQQRSASRGWQLLVMLLGLVTIALDSGIGMISFIYGSVVLVACWSWRAAWVLVPGWVLAIGWTVFGPSDQLGLHPTVGEQVEFALRLWFRSGGALIGGRAWAGAFVLALGSCALAVLVLRRRWVGMLRAVTVAGFLAALLATVALAKSRAGMEGFTFSDFNRYLQYVGLPMALALFPLWWTAARSFVGERVPHWLTALAAAACVLMFVGGIAEERSYVPVFLGWNRLVERGVEDALVVIEDGCPDGSTPVWDSTPVGGFSPQITTDVLRRLLDRGMLSSPLDRAVPDEVLQQMCPAKG